MSIAFRLSLFMLQMSLASIQYFFRFYNCCTVKAALKRTLFKTAFAVSYLLTILYLAFLYQYLAAHTGVS